MINTHNGIKEKGLKPIKIDDYPSIKKHLDRFEPKLSKRADQGDTPYNLRNCAYTDDFFKQKIVWGNLCLKSQFAIADEGMFVNAPSPMIVPANKFILAVLNSPIADWYIRSLGVTRNGGYFEYKPMFIEKVPIPKIQENKYRQFEELVDTILLNDDKLNINSVEQTINQLIYDLFQLSDNEINYMESHL